MFSKFPSWVSIFGCWYFHLQIAQFSILYLNLYYFIGLSRQKFLFRNIHRSPLMLVSFLPRFLYHLDFSLLRDTNRSRPIISIQWSKLSGLFAVKSIKMYFSIRWRFIIVINNLQYNFTCHDMLFYFFFTIFLSVFLFSHLRGLAKNADHGLAVWGLHFKKCASSRFHDYTVRCVYEFKIPILL